MATGTAAVVGGPPRAAVVLEPAATRADGCWTVCHWPEPDLPLGTLVALKVGLPCEPGQRFVANGWQSWAAPTVRTLGHPGTPPPLPGHSRRHLFRLPDSGDSSYDFLATSDAVAGFTEGGGLLVAGVDEQVVYAVRRHVAQPHPPVLVATGDGPALVDDLLGRTAGRVPETHPVSWSTWMAYGERIDSTVLAVASAQVQALAADGLCDALLVDDGWQRSIGDWTPDPARFPADLEELCAGIRAEGVHAGIWTAPVLAAPRSEVVHRYPDWVARHPDGSPVVGADVDHWGGPMWVLDVTRSAVREHLTAVAAAHAAAGFRTFKLDFLYAAVDAAEAAVACGRGGDPATGDVVAPDAVVAAVLDAIRVGAGEEVMMLGCGAPLWPSIGHVDWMRVGPDVTTRYRPGPEPDTDPPMVSCLSNGWRSARLRLPMHRRLWGNDPDSFRLTLPRSQLTPEHRLGFARWVARTGQLLTLSDDPADLDAEDLTEWRRLVAVSRSAPAVPVSAALRTALTR